MIDPLTVPCTYCRAAIGQPCMNITHDNKPLEKQIWHHARRKEAAKVEQELPF